MNRFVKDLTGGIVVIAVAAIVGIAHNAVRSQSVPLIQDVKPVSTVRHGGASAATTVDGVENPADLPEGAVTAEQVKSMFDEGEVYIVDARGPGPFEEGHIPGAINIPYDRLPEYFEDLSSLVPIDARVVIYCWGPDCDFSDQLATELKIMGYADIFVFTGGWEHWHEAGYPGEGSKVEG
jgi:rhodanese-related sulfurtransferase